MIKPGKYNIVAVLPSIMLFLTFSMMHEFDFLLPPSPVATINSSVPTPDVVEETSSEDEIVHDDSYTNMPVINKKIPGLYFPVTGLFIAKVLTPPPDLS